MLFLEIQQRSSKTAKVTALICTQAGLGVGFFFTGLNNMGGQKEFE